jgi:DNA-binding transcriptional ArsR family regulator
LPLPLLDPRTTELKNMHTKLVETLNLDNCPDDYTRLKLEAKYLAGLSDYAFVVMAQRLSAIRDQQLYTQDDYDTFRSFIEGELNLSHTTIYRHLDIFAFFGEHLIKEGEKGGTVYAKLALAVPLLRKEKDDKNRAKLLNKFWHDSKTKSIRQMRSEVSTIIRMHADNDHLALDISKTRKSIEQIKLLLPEKPNKQEVALYLELAKYIEEYCSSI